MKFASKLLLTEPWTNLDANLIPTPFPGCNEYKVKSEQYYDCFARHFTFTIGNAGNLFLFHFLNSRN